MTEERVSELEDQQNLPNLDYRKNKDWMGCGGGEEHRASEAYGTKTEVEYSIF